MVKTLYLPESKYLNKSQRISEIFYMCEHNLNSTLFFDDGTSLSLRLQPSDIFSFQIVEIVERDRQRRGRKR